MPQPIRQTRDPASIPNGSINNHSMIQYDHGILNHSCTTFRLSVPCSEYAP